MWIVPFLLAGLLLGGVWIGISLGLTGIIILYLGGGVIALQSAVVATWNILYHYPLAALPLYILLAQIFGASGVARKSYDGISSLFERVPGKLLVSNVVLCAMFGAVVGSSMATAATVGGIAYPELRKKGYNRTALVGNLAGAGTLGSFIPPSLGMIVYASWVEVSVGGCFAAILFPAIIATALFMIYLVVRCSRPGITPPTAEKLVPLRQAIVKTKAVWPIVVLMITLMGIIYFGLATAVEAAGLACIVAILMSIGFKAFSFKMLRQSLTGTITVCGMLLLIFAGATIFSVAVSVIGLPRQIILAVGELGLPPIAIIAFVCVLYLILGCFFEFMGMMLMTLPFTFPLILGAGGDPFFFAALLVITGEMGLLTPPVGLNLYVLQGITQGEVSLGEVAKGSVPYFLLLGVTLVLVVIFPQLTTWLPAHMH